MGLMQRLHAQEPANQARWAPRRFAPLHVAQARDSERPTTHEPRARPTPRRHTGLLIGGFSVLASSYLVTAIAASAVRSISHADCEAGNIVGPCDHADLMLIPLVGPFLTSRDTVESLILAGPQILGATLLIAGIYHYASPPRRARWQALDLYPVPLRNGGLIAARLRF